MGYMAASGLLAAVYISLTFSGLHLPWFWALILAIVIGGLLPAIGVFSARVRYPIEVTEDGIRFRSMKGQTLMFWHEIRLFACYAEPGPWHNPPALIYELSSASNVVYWIEIQRKDLLNIFRNPSRPLQEHTALMQAFHALIVARTGLPLYDLSKHE
jgi:hypothetical protein